MAGSSRIAPGLKTSGREGAGPGTGGGFLGVRVMEFPLHWGRWYNKTHMMLKC